MSIIDNALQQCVNMYTDTHVIVEQKTTALGDWIIEKHPDGVLRMLLDGQATVVLNYSANGPLIIAGYTLEFPEESITIALVNCSTHENNGTSFLGTATVGGNRTNARMIFQAGTAATSVRTQHSVEIIGRWKQKNRRQK